MRTVTFTSAGHKAVTGETVKSETAGSGWGEIKMISPAAQTSNQATYKLVCGSGSVGRITATAAVTPAARTVSCVTAPPAFTATGSISASKAERVTDHWARQGGANSAPATLTFTKPGTQAVKPLTITPPRSSGSGAAVLVVTSPVSTASSPATYTLTCKAPATQPATNQTAPPAGSTTPPPVSYPPVPHTMSVTVNAPTAATVGQPYSGTVTATGGDGNYTWSAASKLPPGLTATANGATLTISGTPTTGGTFTVTVDVSDSYGGGGAATFDIVVSPAS